jgi:hypothetical protein
MHTDVTFSAQGNQVLLGIVATATPKFFVMNLKVGHGVARLTSPTVATQHLVAEIVILLGIELQACVFRLAPSHDALSVT